MIVESNTVRIREAHDGAGSAMASAPLEALRRQVAVLLLQTDSREVVVRSLIQSDGPILSPATPVWEAADKLLDVGRQALLVVDDQGRMLGAFGEEQVAKIKQQRQREQAVTAMMRRQVMGVRPDQSLREALQVMARSEMGFLPVVENDRLLGEITRAAIILNMYDF